MNLETCHYEDNPTHPYRLARADPAGDSAPYQEFRSALLLDALGRGSLPSACRTALRPITSDRCREQTRGERKKLAPQGKFDRGTNRCRNRSCEHDHPYQSDNRVAFSGHRRAPFGCSTTSLRFLRICWPRLPLRGGNLHVAPLYNPTLASKSANGVHGAVPDDMDGSANAH